MYIFCLQVHKKIWLYKFELKLKFIFSCKMFNSKEDDLATLLFGVSWNF